MIDSVKVMVKNEFTPSYRNLNFKFDTKEKVYNSAMDMLGYFSNIKKQAFYMIDYLTGEIGKDKETNLILENGKYATKEEMEHRKKEYTKYIKNSNIFRLVISFPEGFLEENTDIKKFEQDLAKEIIPMFLKKCRFKDIKNMSYQLALHANTDHKHFHLSIAEKKPNYMISKNKVSYRYKGMFTQEELSFLKNEILHHIQKEQIYTLLLKNVNNEIEDLKKYFNPKERNFILKGREDILIEDKILKLGLLLFDQDLNSNKKIKYNSIKNKEIKNLTKEIKTYIFKNELKDEYNNFLNGLEDINRYFESLSVENKTKIVDDSLIKSKKEYLDNYVLNAIVNQANNEFKSKKINEELLIKAIVQKTYNKSMYKTKYDVIKNNLIYSVKPKQYVNQHKLNQAIKNINYELEEAIKEFDKLFNIEKTRNI